LLALWFYGRVDTIDRFAAVSILAKGSDGTKVLTVGGSVVNVGMDKTAEEMACPVFVWDKTVVLSALELFK